MAHSPTPNDTPHVPAWRRYTRFWGARVEADVDEELQFHIEMRTREYVARGMSERDARAAAVERLGTLTAARNACLTIGHRRQRRMTRAQTIDAFAQDLQYSLRTLGRQKAWTVVALLTLALGIGASTAVFSVVNSLVLNPLPYPHANRVAMVWREDPTAGLMIGAYGPMIKAWKTDARTIEALEEFDAGPVTLTENRQTKEIYAARIGASFLAFAGSRLIAGRNFLPAEEQKGGDPVVLISEQFWSDHYGKSRDAIGEHITIDGASYTIIGVVPASLRLPAINTDRIDVWLSLAHASAFRSSAPLVRVRAGASDRDVERELDAIIARHGIDARIGSRPFVTRLRRPGDFVGFKDSLYLLSGAVGLLLLVSCANVAHLLLARGATRERELSIRAALGASRRRLTRQLLTEALVLAAIGGVCGVAFGYVGVKLLLALRPTSLTQLGLTRMDGPALTTAIVLSLVTGVAFGLTAAIHALRRTTSDSLRATSLAGTGNRGTHKLRSILVVTEMAMSAMLLVGAVLLVRSVAKLQRVDAHFEVADLFAAHVELTEKYYPSDAPRAAFVASVVERARLVPGVRAVTVAQNSPPHFGYMMTGLEVEGDASAPTSNATAFNTVAPDYFNVLGLRLLRGRTFDAGSNDRHEIILSEGTARKLWASVSPIGRRVRFPAPPGATKPNDWMTVVGIADNAPTGSPLSTLDPPLLYLPLDARHVPGDITVVVRTNRGDHPVDALRKAVTSLDPRLVPPAVSTVASDLAATISGQRFTMTLLAVFASLAVLLSAIGLYGVISYVVTQRTREIGIRIALGATPRHVARIVVAKGLVLSAIGVALGLAVGSWGTKVIRAALYGVTGTDPLSYAVTGALLLSISILASLIPMRRAMRVDPVIAMRGD